MRFLIDTNFASRRKVGVPRRADALARSLCRSLIHPATRRPCPGGASPRPPRRFSVLSVPPPCALCVEVFCFFLSNHSPLVTAFARLPSGLNLTAMYTQTSIALRMKVTQDHVRARIHPCRLVPTQKRALAPEEQFRGANPLRSSNSEARRRDRLSQWSASGDLFAI